MCNIAQDEPETLHPLQWPRGRVSTLRLVGCVFEAGRTKTVEIVAIASLRPNRANKKK